MRLLLLLFLLFLVKKMRHPQTVLLPLCTPHTDTQTHTHTYTLPHCVPVPQSGLRSGEEPARKWGIGSGHWTRKNLACAEATLLGRGVGGGYTHGVHWVAEKCMSVRLFSAAAGVVCVCVCVCVGVAEDGPGLLRGCLAFRVPACRSCMPAAATND